MGTAADPFDGETTIAGLLRAVCAELTAALDADGCNLSRVIGQLLVDLVEHARDGRRIQLGRSYLVPDYPVTQEVVESLDARTVWLLDPQADPAEASLLRELDFDSLLMLPLVIDGRCWGLVEVYRAGPFHADDVEKGRAVVTSAAARIEQLQRRAAAA